MWEYKIVKSDLGRNIYKKKEKDWLIHIRFLYHHDRRWLNKARARTFYHKEDALSTLIIMKVKDGKDAD